MAALANYELTPRYRAGRQNADADGLSRKTVDTDVLTALATAVMATVEEAPLCFSIADPDVIDKLEQETTVPDDIIQAYALSSKDWRKSQMSDPVIAELINHIQQGTRPTL
ncbi:hypothetical protein DPMN_020927 [Dreissena polymorpha]|uniref:Uncharacterized protein n=1 Tax=Dreissena polymorpha TaxID=45954 RepID=A0A9D4SBF5_DREPO|nr:hypothetical protein DPMN_020927 [Dreissena polymorpha]